MCSLSREYNLFHLTFGGLRRAHANHLLFLNIHIHVRLRQLHYSWCLLCQHVSNCAKPSQKVKLFQIGGNEE